MMLSRRELVLAVLAAAVPLDAALAKASPREPLLQVFRRPASAVAIGRRYLASLEGKVDADRLWAEVGDRIAGALPADGTDRAAAIAVSVCAAVRADFAAERLVAVDGWLLADIEAKLCALCALDDRAIA